MKANKFLFPSAFSILILFVILINACTKDKTPVPLEPCDPTKTYFQNDVMPIINSNCAKSGCHDAITRSEGYNLSNYSGVMQIVKPWQPSKSKLMEVINSGKSEGIMPPRPNAPLSQVQIEILTKWISQGALNISCVQDTGGCSSTNISFGGEVSKILNSNCLGCHSGSSVSGGVNLSNYAGVQSVALSGKLYNSISQNGAAVPMPPSLKLQPCDIKKIKSWVDAGSKNN